MQIIKSTLLVSFVTFASRILGYLRDLLIASSLGAGPLNDVFLIAFRLANLFRSLFGEGAFNTAFIPIFTGLIQQKGLLYAKKFASLVQTFLLLFLIAFSILMVTFMPEIISVTAPGIGSNIYYLNLTIELSRITFPYLVLISMVAFYGGMLNSIYKFFPFASISLWFNVILIAAISCSDYFTTKAHALSYGLIIAGLVELVWVLCFAKVHNLLVPFARPRPNPHLRKMFGRITVGMIGSGVVQINTWVDMVLASFIPSGISFLYFADRIMQLPLAIIGTAASFTLLPTLSKSFQEKNYQEAVKVQNVMLRFGMFFAIPACVGLVCLSEETVRLLLERGQFTEHSTAKTALALVCFAIGLPACVLNKIFVTYFHSQGDLKTPVKIGGICIISNIIIGCALLGPLEHAGVALASSCSAWFSASALIYTCYCRGLYAIDSKTLSNIIKCALAATMMAVMLIVLKNMALPLMQALAALLYIIAGGAAYIGICFMVRAVSWPQLRK